MSLDSLRKTLSTLPGSAESSSGSASSSAPFKSFYDTVNPPKQIKPFELPDIGGTMPVSTPQIGTPGMGTIDMIKSGLHLINPMTQVTIRPLFATDKQQVQVPGGLFGEAAHNLVARTIEMVPRLASQLLATARTIKTGEEQSVKLPFDVSRIGIDTQGASNEVQDPFQDARLFLEKRDKESPDTPNVNLMLATLRPVMTALDALGVESLLSSVARSGLKATAYSPELNTAIQQYGLQGLKGEDLTNEFVRKFNLKATKFIKAEDHQGLDELGRATNTILTHMTGKGIPTLNRFGQIVQDVSRLALQDSKYGFSLHNPLSAEIAPEVAVKGLPGHVYEENPIAVGARTVRVRHVGGEGDDNSPGYFRSKAGEFEPVAKKDAMPAPIRKDLDTFVTKDGDGFAVIEGKTGQQLGQTESTMSLAIVSARNAVDDMSKTKLDKLINQSPLSPRYEQVDKSETKSATKSESKSIPYGESNRTPAQLQKDTTRLISEGKLPAGAKTPFDDEGIIRVREENAKLPRTHEIKTPEREALRTRILDEAYGSGAAKKEKRLDIVMGPPAAAKSELFAEPLAKEHGALLADSDKLKKKLPEINHGGEGSGSSTVHQESANINAQLIKRGMENGDNIVFPTIGRNIDALKKLVDTAKEKGYEVHVTHVDLPIEKAAGRAIARYRDPKKGQFVDPHYIINEVGLHPRKNFAIIKTHEGVRTHQEYSNDVEKGTAPKLRAAGENPAHRVDKGGMQSAPGGSRGADSGRREELISQDDSLALLGRESQSSEFELNRSLAEEDRIELNLTRTFADLKGVEAADLKLKFSDEELEEVKAMVSVLEEAIRSDPAGGLMKYRSKATGRLPEITGKETRDLSSTKGGKKKTVKNSKYGQHGDKIIQNIFGNDNPVTDDQAQEYLDRHLKMREDYADWYDRQKEISKNIRLSKQRESFVGKNKERLARQASKNVEALSNLVKVAQAAGFKKGFEKGSARYYQVVKEMRMRIREIKAIQDALNLSDTEMRNIRREKYTDKNGKVRHRDRDPRVMSDAEFAGYIKGLENAAEKRSLVNRERVIVDAIIKEKNLKKIENLQRALQLPKLENMSIKQLQEFGDILAKTPAYETFLGPRMIQTAANSDLGAIRTVEDGIKAVLQQSGVENWAGLIEGSEMHEWMRDPTLARQSPMHRFFIEKFAAKQADMITRRDDLIKELNKKAGAARKSRRRVRDSSFIPRVVKSMIERFAPQDRLVAQWLQPFKIEYDDNGKRHVVPMPGIRTEAQKRMTKEELAYAHFLRDLFEKYYTYAKADATQRWTLGGVRNSKFEDMYLPHVSPGALERIRNDGIFKGLRNLFNSIEEVKTTVDFNAFGDRGQVLGMEKWLNRSMTREGEGVRKDTGKEVYSLNTAKIALSYFNAFEKKIMVDSMTPEIKMLEFLFGKKFQTPKSISNPMGTEKVHSELTRQLNQWINNKKGQKIKFGWSQGSQVERYVDSAGLLLSLWQLGGNISTQLVSSVGAQLMTLRGARFKGWTKGHLRAKTKQGRAIGRKYSGLFQEDPWQNLGSALNDAGEDLVGGLFFMMSKMSFWSQRQMMLGLLTKEEFLAGEISKKRQGEIALKIGEWHDLPRFRSVAGNTSAIKLASPYIGWAIPAFQTSMVDLTRLIKQAKGIHDKESAKRFFSSDAYKNTITTILMGLGAWAFGQLVVKPDDKDKSTLALYRYKAARELGSIIQAYTFVGLVSSNRNIDFLKQLSDAAYKAAQLAVDPEAARYKTSGAGYKEGDLKVVQALQKLITPQAVNQFLPKDDSSSSSSGGAPKKVTLKKKAPKKKLKKKLKKR